MAQWTSISDSEFPWEQDALAFIRSGIPASSPIQAWSNFEFMAEGGAIYEVDLLVIGPWGAFLIEIKSIPGVVSSHGGSWTWRDGTSFKTRDNPLPLVNRKIKALKSLFERQKAFGKEKVPFIEPLVFCSDVANVLNLQGAAQNGVCLRDRQDKSVPGILGAIARRDCPGLRTYPRPPISKDQIRAFCRGVEEISLRPLQKARKAGDYILKELFHDSPVGTYQEWLGHHVRINSGPKLIRAYLQNLHNEKERAILKRAAEREFQILERIEHEGILRVDTLTETESGPALVFRWQEGAQRLDHYLAERTEPLAAHISLEILRQITEAIAYAHRKKVVHRGLSPQSIIVLPEMLGDAPKVQIFSWQLGIIEAGTAGGATRTALSRSLHAGQFVEDEAKVFFAPEAVSGQIVEGEELDSFSIGALAYHLFSGKPPADSLLDLDKKLRQKGYLDICAVQNGVTPKLAELVEFTARVDRELRLGAEEILEYLDQIWDEMTTPDAAEVVDPRIAKAGDLIENGFRVVRDLGSGSCSKVLLVDAPEGGRQVLKVASKQEYSERLRQEFETIKKIRHPNVIQAFEILQFNGVTGFTMEPAFSMDRVTDMDERGTRKETSLARRLREDGPLDISLLQRFGEEMLQTIDGLERLGISHRDIKPDNLGIRSVNKGPLQLVLFDFSLANSPAEDIRLGTPPYLDPYLPLRKPSRWDHHAERFGAAMTLHEMAAGVTPVCGGRGAAHLTNDDIELRPELLPESIRERIVAFFRKSLAREVSDRYDNTEEMLIAWRRVFDRLDEPVVWKGQDVGGNVAPPSLGEILGTATPDMPLVILGLGARLMNVLDRLEVITIADLLRYPIGRIKRLRGVGYKTSQEAIELFHLLRTRFPDIESKELLAEAAKDASEAPELASVDLIARQLLVSAPGTKHNAERDIQERFLGWTSAPDDPASLRWPSQTDLGNQVELTRARIGQIIAKAREKWLKNSALTRLRESICSTLLSLGGVATHEELIRLVLLTRGSTLSEPDSLRMASIATRAAVEAERHLQSPRFIESRRQGTHFIAVDPACVAFALQLGEAGRDLASRDPLPTAARVIETLSAIPFPEIDVDDLNPPDQARRAHLAAAVNAGVCVNGRLELYPRHLAADRALALSRNALFGVRELTLEEIRGRVASRYPEAAPLPDRPELDRLLEQVGFPMKWDSTAAGGKGAYQSKHTGPGGGTSYTIGSRAHTLDRRPPGQSVSDEDAEALRIEDKLRRSREEGAYLVLEADPKLLTPAAKELRRFQVEEVSASALFLEALKAEAAKLGVAWEVVLEADAAKPGDADWSRLQELVRRALPSVLQQLRIPGRDILLTDAGLFARYGRMNEIDALRNDTGTKSGPHSLWILIPGHGGAATPRLCHQAVPLTNESQFERLPLHWVRNRHRGGNS